MNDYLEAAAEAERPIRDLLDTSDKTELTHREKQIVQVPVNATIRVALRRAGRDRVRDVCR